MNRITILCRKAEELVTKVIFEGENELEKDGIITRKSYFTFKLKDPPSVTITSNGQYTYLESCSCKAHSVIGGLPDVNMKNLCSYTLAVYKSLGVKK